VERCRPGHSRPHRGEIRIRKVAMTTWNWSDRMGAAQIGVGNPVAVEKVGFSEKSRKSDDRKCLGDWEKSFVELPDAKQFFCELLVSEFFNSQLSQNRTRFFSLIVKKVAD
jgi:hypothetical protein